MDEKTRSKWGYMFQWTVNHISREEANLMRYEYDTLGAAALQKLQEDSLENFSGQDKAKSPGKVDLYALLRDKYQTDPVLSEFWHELHTVPAWVDWEQIARGQEFFYRYAVANITGFALQGFVGENSAASGVVEVFVRTGGFSTKVLLYRLMETFQWLIQITHELSSIQPGGEGHASTIRARLLQAFVRQRILKLVKTRPEFFNAEKYGVPVNNLDSIHSICVFCCNPMWLQLPKMGIAPKKQEIADYIALFRYIAYLLATPTQYFETAEKAKAVMESMYLNELEPSEISKIVGHNFVRCLEDLPPFNISREFMEAGSRWINGDTLCDALDLGRPGWYHYALMTGLSWIIRSVALLQRTIPSFDRFIVDYFRKTLYQSIILRRSRLRGPTVFELNGAPQPKRLVERFLLLGFLIGCVLQAVMIISGLAVGMRMWQRLVEILSSVVHKYHRNTAIPYNMGAEQQWVAVQQKTFTKWLNSKVNPRDVHVNDLVTDLSDGVILIHLLEVLGNESLGRYASKPKLRVQRFENVNKALDFVKARGIQMTNIGAEDVVDGNKKIILGLIWTLILRFTISDINEEGMTAKEGLLLWCQRKTACYEEVEVRDFSGSWNDGLAFCALLDIHRPDLIDYEKLDKSDHRGNMQLAFDIASKEIGIPDLLDVEDVCDVAKPDERSLMTYIAYWFHAFSQMERVENAGRRVEKFVTNMQGAWGMQNSFEQRMKDLLQEIRVQRQKWEQATFTGVYADAKEQSSQFAVYKKSQKRKWVAEKSDLAALLGNIKTKMGTYRLRPYEPPDHLKLEVLDNEWGVLLKAERNRSQIINETIRDIKNNLRRSFADRANDFALTLNTLSLAISGLEGDIDDQCSHVQRLNENLPPLNAFLSSLSLLDEQCAEANIEENDFTTYTYDELAYELGLVKSSVAKKLSFLENQMVARNMTNLTPIQLEEFESVFRHFDRDLSNSLQELEFSAALASLGLVYDEQEMKETFRDVAGGRGRVTFEQFIRFMVSVTEDQNTAEQVFQSFREVADGKPYVTEMDLRHSLIPDDLVEDLLASMPPHKGPDLQEDRHLPKFDYVGFMDNITNAPVAAGSPKAVHANGNGAY